MGEVRAGRTRQTVLEDGRHRTSVKVSYGGEKRELWFVTDASVPFVDRNRGDLWLPPLLVLAMRRGEDLRLADPISGGRRPRLQKIQDIFVAWYPERMSRVRIAAPPAEPRPEPPRRGVLRRRTPPVDDRVVGTCFTGGVDSFNTLVKHQQRMGALVYGFGIDVPSHEVEATERVAEMLDSVASETGTRLLGVETNMRRFLGRGQQVSWGFESHGAVLASLATLFSTVVSTLYIPSTHSYAVTFPWGSHPLLDPLWSTRRVTIEHDGSETGRVGKLRRIADDPTAQGHLRVCYKQFALTNCGECMKCTRTMATLTLLDRLDRFTTFSTPFDVERLRSLELRLDNDLFQIRDVYELALQVPEHLEIREALESLMATFQEQRDAGIPTWRPGQGHGLGLGTR